jgi:Trk-type K+ transport system membrane component
MARELFRRLRPYGQMPQTLLIGGLPGSSAGGIKTTELAISLAEFKNRLKGDDQVVMLDRPNQSWIAPWC